MPRRSLKAPYRSDLLANRSLQTLYRLLGLSLILVLFIILVIIPSDLQVTRAATITINFNLPANSTITLTSGELLSARLRMVEKRMPKRSATLWGGKNNVRSVFALQTKALAVNRGAALADNGRHGLGPDHELHLPRPIDPRCTSFDFREATPPQWSRHSLS